MTTDIPKPGPTPPIRALPAKSTGGLNDDGAEKRRRIVMDLLPYSRDAIRSSDDFLSIVVWIATGDLTVFYDDEEKSR